MPPSVARPLRRRIAHRGRRAEPRESPAGHAVLVATFLTAIVTALAATGRRGHLAERITAADLALLCAATHKLTRIIALDRVTSPFREPFAECTADSTGAGEVGDDPRGTGLRNAIGQLLTCPYCLSPWIAGAMMTGLLFVPRRTRLIAAMLAIVAASDTLNLVYSRLKEMNQ